MQRTAEQSERAASAKRAAPVAPHVGSVERVWECGKRVWLARSVEGTPLVTARTRREALVEGERVWLEHGTPERSAETARRARINFAARLWGEEEV